MDKKHFEEIKARYSGLEMIVAGHDVMELLSELERLTDQHQCDVHNIAAMKATLDQQAKNCEELIESYKKSNLEQAEENYELEKENATLKSECDDYIKIGEDYRKKLLLSESERDTLKNVLEFTTNTKNDYFMQMQSYIKAFRLYQSAFELMCSDLLSAYATPINPESIDQYTKNYIQQAQEGKK